MTWLAVAVGSALGGVARYGLGLAVARAVGVGFPWGTLLINVLGSFVIGLYGAMTLSDGPMPASPTARAFVMVGICGGFTTFSTFSLQTVDLLQAGEPVAAGAYIVASLALCLAGTFLGYWIATQVGVPSRVGP
jgi:CrcB protein